MTVINRWEETTKRVFGRPRSEDQLLHRHFFWHQSGFPQVGVYIEIYYDASLNELYAYGTSCAASPGPRSFKSLRCTSIPVVESIPLALEISANLESNGILVCRFEQEISRGDGVWRLKRIETKLTQCQSLQPKAEVNWTEDFSDLGESKVGGESIQVVCPRCMGVGWEQSMAIPSSDNDGEKSGYALFSCNRTSSKDACPACGGAGSEYEHWYLEEHPDLFIPDQVFRPGSGKVRIERLSHIQRLHRASVS